MNNSADTAPAIEIRGLRKAFGDLEVLRGIDLDVPVGQVISVIGPSGSGKSTLLRVLMTLEEPSAGTVKIHGEPFLAEVGHDRSTAEKRRRIHAIRRHIGMVFQHFNLFPHMTVLRNVTEAPIHVAGLTRAEATEQAMEFLSMVGIAEKAKAWPSELSGGQKQRVAIARALAMHPRIMLFDEITSALDPELVGGILDLVRKIAERRQMTILIVTHEMRFARESSDRTLFFEQGVIVEDGPPSMIFTDPANQRTREFLASVLGDIG